MSATQLLVQSLVRPVLPSKGKITMLYPGHRRYDVTSSQPLFGPPVTPRNSPRKQPRVRATFRARSFQLAFVTAGGNNQPTVIHGLVRP